MHKNELIERLQAIEGNPEIYIDERVTDFRFGLLNGVTKREIDFSEEPTARVMASGEVIVLSEE